MEGITDAMKQYERSTEEIYRNKPKRSRPHGIKRPDAVNIVGVLAGLFLLLVLATEFI